MSWSIEEHIGEGRPWPAQVVVYRGETDECLAYVSGEVADRLQAENAKLRERVAELEELLPENGRWYRAETVEAYVAEIAKLEELVKELYADYAKEWVTRAEDVYLDRIREFGIEVDG